MIKLHAISNRVRIAQEGEGEKETKQGFFWVNNVWVKPCKLIFIIAENIFWGQN